MSRSGKTIADQRTVLMLMYPYAPLAAAGTFRGMRFVKYLPECGWNPLVVTIREKDIPSARLDESLRECVPEGLVVRRTGSLRPIESLSRAIRGLRAIGNGRHRAARNQNAEPESSTFSSGDFRGGDDGESSSFVRSLREVKDLLCATPDCRTTWVLPALAAALPLVRRYRPRVIYSTGPPHSSHLIAVALKWLTGLPIMLDLRDPWTNVHWKSTRAGKLRQRVNQWLERLCIQNADRVVLNTTVVMEDVLGRYPHEPRSKFSVITNGYDPEPSICRQQLQPDCGQRSDNGTIRLCHPGVIYGKRDLRPMIDAVRHLRQSGVSVRFEQIGPVENIAAIKSRIESLGLEDAVLLTGRLSYAETLHRMADADVFVLFQQGTAMQIPGKVFEMLPFGKPILAMTQPEGMTARTVEDFELGEVVSSSDPELIADTIHRLARNNGFHATSSARQRAMSQFDGRELTRKFADVLNEIAQSGNA